VADPELLARCRPRSSAPPLIRDVQIAVASPGRASPDHSKVPVSLDETAEWQLNNKLLPYRNLAHSTSSEPG
jgi:hypothetical protein